jgi:hypothetical protein
LTHTTTTKRTPTIHLVYLTGPLPSNRVLLWIEVDVDDRTRKTTCTGKIDVNEAENPSRSQWPCGLGRGSSAAWLWDCGFESHGGHGCLLCQKTMRKASQNKQVEPLGKTWSYYSLSKN